MTGRIIKCLAGVYDVLCGDELVSLRAAGRFRARNVTPLVGDIVQIEDGLLTKIEERKNELVRPPLANVDTLIVTVAAHTPEPDFLLADKLICFCRAKNITPVLCVNKCDLDPETAGRYAEIYEKSGIRTVIASAQDKKSVQKLRELFAGVTCFCGQSAVGKSSLTNALIGSDRFETGLLSKKTARGRHTTRHCELIPLENGCFLADTPGFSLLELMPFSPEAFRDLYEEYRPFEENCRFVGCFHDREPDCAVKEAIEGGLLPRERYERYLVLLHEVIEKWGKRYD